MCIWYGMHCPCDRFADGVRAIHVHEHRLPSSHDTVNDASLVSSADNPADLLTKNVPPATMIKHVQGIRMEHQAGRSQLAANLHTLAKKEARINMKKTESDRWLDRLTGSTVMQANA